ncbi:MAG: SDR family NAD(P)-dependent oxidoreductase [Pseudomonadota bacterium]
MAHWQHSIISGGGSGLGLGLAERLLRRGGKVSLLDLSLGNEARHSLDTAATAGGGDWQYQEANLTDEARVNEVVNASIDAFGAPDLAINSAGILINKPFADTDSDGFRRVMDVNVTGSFHFAKAVLPHMSPGGRLALIASMAGLVSNYGYSAYGTSKFAVIGLATTLRYEYEPRGIGISCICPPEVRTPMVTTERSPGQADPISLALKDVAGHLELDEACNAMLKGIDRGRWMIIPGRQSKLIAFVARYFPRASMAFSLFLVRRLLRQHGQL